MQRQLIRIDTAGRRERRHDRFRDHAQSHDVRRGRNRARLCGAGACCRSSSRRMPTRRNTPFMPICSPPAASLPYSRSSIATTTGPAELPPLTIDGKPNYNMGPVKFATVAAVVWGIAGFTVGLWAALELAFPGAQFRSALALVRPHPAAAHLGGDLRLRRQRADRDLVLCRAAHLPRPPRRRRRALVRRARLQLLHRHRRHRLSARHHPVEGICRARMVRRSVADRRLGRLLPGLSRHDHAARPSRTSTSRTGSISPSS